MKNNQSLKNILEAIIFTSDEPITFQQISSLFENNKPTKNELNKVIEDLNKEYNNRAFEIVNVASGYRIQIKKGYEEWLSKLNATTAGRYSKAFLETLVIIAYRQPVTRGDIEDIRGVTVNPHIIRNLLDREWIKVIGHKETPGKPELLATTKKFLDYFNLKSLSELPIVKEQETL